MQDTYNQSRPVPVLLIGYNRIEKLRDRMHEIIKFADGDLYISIDFESNLQQLAIRKMLEVFIQDWPSARKITVIYQTENLGLANHITSAITKVLEECESVIVVEDDIKISEEFIAFATQALNQDGFSSKYASVCGFSVIQKTKKIHFINFSRDTIYFFCWGWGTRKEIWEKYNLQLEPTQIQNELKRSEIWNSLSHKQQETWLGRFHKVASNPKRTWDIQFQYLTFKEDLRNLAPIFRVTENYGFDDNRSSNTKDERPWWLGKDKLMPVPISNRLPECYNSVFDYIDSNTLIGDSDFLQKIYQSIKNLVVRNRKPV